MTIPAMLGRDVNPDEYGRIETFPVASPVRVEFITDELQALCPAVEGIQPDIYQATINYLARSAAIESKSLKLWLVTFRERRIFAEHLALEMVATLSKVPGIDRVGVRLIQNIRGGIVTVVTAGEPL